MMNDECGCDQRQYQYLKHQNHMGAMDDEANCSPESRSLYDEDELKMPMKRLSLEQLSDGFGDEHKKVAPALRRALLTLIQVLPSYGADLMKPLKTINITALKEGQKPVGPDMEMTPELMIMSILSSLFAKKSFTPGEGG